MIGNFFFLLQSKSKQKSMKKDKVLLQGVNCIILMLLWRLFSIRRKNSMCIVVLHVKLQPKRTKFVEMRAKSVWQSKIIDFEFWPNLKVNKKARPFNFKMSYMYQSFATNFRYGMQCSLMLMKSLYLMPLGFDWGLCLS